MEIFFFKSRIRINLCNELYVIDVLWNFKNIFKRGVVFMELRIINMFLFFEDYFVLGDLE